MPQKNSFMKTLVKLSQIPFLGLLLISISCSTDKDDEDMIEPLKGDNIVETVQATADLSSLVSALQKADESTDNDLISTLSGDGPFTVFAPTNAAFADLLGQLDGFDSLDDFSSQELQNLLATILTYHIIPGVAALSSDLTDGQTLTTLQGSTIHVSTEGEVLLSDTTSEDAKVTTANVETSNGVVHVINKILLPQVVIDQLDGILLDTDTGMDTPVFQDYHILYDRTNDTTEVRAIFREHHKEGRRIQLSGNSSVLFNGETWDEFYNIFFISFYQWKREGIQNVKVNYIKNPKESFINSFETTNAPDLDFEDDFDELSLENKNTVGWKGGPLEENETIGIELIQGGEPRFRFLDQTPAGSTLEIDLSMNGRLTEGEAKIRMLRGLTIDNLDHTDKKAGGRVTYTTIVEKNINIGA